MSASTSPNGRSGIGRSSPISCSSSWSRASGPTSGSGGARIRTSPSRPWWCRSAGRAPRSADTLQQITDRLESKLQETPNLDYLKSYTTAGPDDDLRQPEGFDAARPGAGHLVPGAQEGWRHPRHAAAGDRRPRLQRRVRRHLRHRLRLHRRRLHPPRAEGLCRAMSASSSCSFRTSPRSTSSARRTSASMSSSRPSSWRGSASTAPR